ncbi:MULTISPECIES: hypothetical protein [unclassified Dyella]|uniref:hypothetical protein n=1 Tax=Dyella sp. ASV21 TaxID=2795114 RepID=UPI0018EB6C8D|nr:MULTISPECIES: hypothetical protein [unclassified Dyella]
MDVQQHPELDPIIASLDTLYQGALDGLEAFTRHALAVTDRLSDMKLTVSRLDGLSIVPERAMSPQDAFRQLADILVTRARPVLDPFGQRSRVRVEDLIDWSGEPPRHNLSHLQHGLQKIDYARSKSLRDFFQRVVIRLTPEAVPDHAKSLAAFDLVGCIGVALPNAHVVRYARTDAGTIASMRLGRDEGQMPWHLTPAHLIAIDKMFVALAAVCAIAGMAAEAVQITERGESIVQRLRQSTTQYKSGDQHVVGLAARMTLHRDRIDILFAPDVWQVIQDVITECISGVKFIDNA